MTIFDKNNLSFGNFRIDTAHNVLRHNNEIVSLPLKSVELLCLLVENRGKVISKEEIFEKVWKDSFVEDSVLTNNIYKLRKIFEEFDEKDLITTVPRRGYVFNFENKDSLTIEREIYEEIEIVETETLSEKPILALPAKQTRNFNSILFASAAILIITLGVFAFWTWNNTTKSSAKSEIRSLAVLPIKSFDSNSVDEQIRLKITDALITKFGNLKDVTVRPTSAIIEYSESDKTAMEIGKELQVDTVLDGNCQLEGENLRINFQLISVNDGNQIWSEQFNGNINSLLKFQDDLSAKFLTKLSLPLSVNEMAIFKKRPTENLDAYQNYLKGRYFRNAKNLNLRERFATARKFYEKAIEIDPKFALAYADLASLVGLQSVREHIPRKEGFDLARMLAAKGYELDPNMAETNAALGYAMQPDTDQTNAQKFLLRAIELNPNHTSSYAWLSYSYLMQREYQKEIEILLAGRKIDPTNYTLLYELVVAYQAANQCNKSLELLPEAISLEGDSPGKSNIEATSYSVCGKNAEALPILERIWKESLEKPNSSLLSQLGYSNAKLRNREKALEFVKMIGDKKGIKLYEKVIPIYLALGDKVMAYRLLEEMSVKAPHRLFRIDSDLRMISLRDDPRFIKLKNKLKLK